MANNLPTEIIIEEILPKLPAKTLLRFKCVSKSFKTLISSPNFIDNHLPHSLSSAANRRIVGFSLRGSHLFDLNSPQLPPSPFPLPSDFLPNLSNGFVGSCNGLLFIIGHNRLLNGYCSLLINPITGFYRFFGRKLYLSYGFGFDPVTGDYKFIKIDEDGFMIYSLINGSWHLIANPGDEITSDLIGNLFVQSEFAVVVNRCLCHWLVWCAAQKKHRIVCLDLSTEKWSLGLSLPDYEGSCSVSLFETCRDKKYDVIHLVNFEGYLSVSTRNMTIYKNFDVWVMKVYGVAESWVKLFSVSDEWSVPLCYSPLSKSRVLVRNAMGGRNSRIKNPRIIWYDVRDEHLHKAEIDGAHGFDRLFDACVFTGSLVNCYGP